MKFLYLDFEFNNINSGKLNLVSLAAAAFSDGEPTEQTTIWLHNSPSGQAKAKGFLRRMIAEEYIFVAFVMEAEARSLHSLFGGMPKFKAIDLYLEYRNVLNHNNSLSYGVQYLKGKVVTTSPPPSKWRNGVRVEAGEEGESHHKPSFSLAAATFKLLGIQIDTEEKNQVRDIIIRSNHEEIESAAGRIMRYNSSDIENMPDLLSKIYNINRRCGETLGAWTQSALGRGAYAVATARMVIEGYPINLAKVNKFTKNVGGIINAAIQDCLEHSSEVESFRFDKKTDKYVAVEKNIREWISAQPAAKRWRVTGGGKLSLSKDSFCDFYSSDSPGFAGSFVRFLKTKTSLNGFMPPTQGRATFSDFIGKDGRVRPFMGIFGSQSSRSQPAATSFLWLKSKFLQNFLEAPAGRALIACDYSSQEFLIAGIVAQDLQMIDAYRSGDVYLAFGITAGLIPKTGTKTTHKKERDLCKTVILGLSYGMASEGLAVRLEAATGTPYTGAQAQKFVDLFNESYPDYSQWKWDTQSNYDASKFLRLSDGWRMSGDNPSKLSVLNFPIQGEGAVILRTAVQLCQSRGLRVIATVHDSIVCDIPAAKARYCADLLKECMVEAFEVVMVKFGSTAPIRVEGECWSQSFTKSQQIGDFAFSRELIHPRAVSDHARYEKYFT